MPTSKSETQLITGYIIREQREEYNLSLIIEKLKSIESDRGISQFCRDIGLSRNHLYLIANGKTNSTEATMEKILKGLHLSWSDIKL